MCDRIYDNYLYLKIYGSNYYCKYRLLILWAYSDADYKVYIQNIYEHSLPYKHNSIATYSCCHLLITQWPVPFVSIIQYEKPVVWGVNDLPVLSNIVACKTKLFYFSS